MKKVITSEYAEIFDLFAEDQKLKIVDKTKIFRFETHLAVIAKYDYAIIVNNIVMHQDNSYQFKNERMALIKAICLVNRGIITYE